MIVDILFFVVASVIYLLAAIFGAIAYVIPVQIGNALPVLISYTDYFRGIWPVASTLQAIGGLISFLVLWYTVKLALKIYSLLPFIGKKATAKGGK